MHSYVYPQKNTLFIIISILIKLYIEVKSLHSKAPARVLFVSVKVSVTSCLIVIVIRVILCYTVCVI